MGGLLPLSPPTLHFLWRYGGPSPRPCSTRGGQGGEICSPITAIGAVEWRKKPDQGLSPSCCCGRVLLRRHETARGPDPIAVKETTCCEVPEKLALLGNASPRAHSCTLIALRGSGPFPNSANPFPGSRRSTSLPAETRFWPGATRAGDAEKVGGNPPDLHRRPSERSVYRAEGPE